MAQSSRDDEILNQLALTLATELAQELSHDLHTRYIDKQLKKAEAEVRKRGGDAEDSGAWSGMGLWGGPRVEEWARREANAERRTSSVPSATNQVGRGLRRGLELAQWTVGKYDKFVDEWIDEAYWTHRESGVTVWDELNVGALLPPGMAEKFPERLVIEDRTNLPRSGRQAEARMELKEGLEDADGRRDADAGDGRASDDEEEGGSAE